MPTVVSKVLSCPPLRKSYPSATLPFRHGWIHREWCRRDDGSDVTGTGQRARICCVGLFEKRGLTVSWTRFFPRMKCRILVHSQLWTFMIYCDKCWERCAVTIIRDTSWYQILMVRVRILAHFFATYPQQTNQIGNPQVIRTGRARRPGRGIASKSGWWRYGLALEHLGHQWLYTHFF